MISDVRSLAFSLKLLSVSETLYPEGQTTATQKAVADFIGPGHDVFIFSRNSLLPPFVIADTGDAVYCWVSGVHNARQGLSVLVNASGQLEEVGDWKSNPLFIASGRSIFDTLIKRVGGLGKRWYLVGHSYGGALLSVTALLLKATYPEDEVQLCTFGSPRPGNDEMCAKMRSLIVRRWMNEGDPVPRFPPHFLEAPAASATAGYAVSRNWSSYGQPRGGVVLHSDGTFQSRPLPPLNYPIQDAVLADWITGVGGIQVAQHTLVYYRANMTAALLRLTDVSPGVTVGSVADKGEKLSLGEFIKLATGAAVPGADSITAEVGKVTYIPMGDRATVTRVGVEYAVVWQNGVVGAGKTLAGARALKRDFNKMLRSLQNLGFLNRTAFLAAWGEYISAASTPGLGFEPVMVVT